jgi:tRNA(adenine34) deaminase
MFNADDRQWMTLALHQAEEALSAGDYPVGAVLTMDNQLIGTARNSLFSDARTTAHAEHNLLAEHSAYLRKTMLAATDTHLCLYTTLEPCLMCLGTAVLHRVSRIVIACPDPNGGTTNLNVSSLGSAYTGLWPIIDIGLYRAESCRLIIQFLQTKKFQTWETMLAEFQQLQSQWQTEPAITP